MAPDLDCSGMCLSITIHTAYSQGPQPVIFMAMLPCDGIFAHLPLSVALQLSPYASGSTCTDHVQRCIHAVRGSKTRSWTRSTWDNLTWYTLIRYKGKICVTISYTSCTTQTNVGVKSMLGLQFRALNWSPKVWGVAIPLLAGLLLVVDDR